MQIGCSIQAFWASGLGRLNARVTGVWLDPLGCLPCLAVLWEYGLGVGWVEKSGILGPEMLPEEDLRGSPSGVLPASPI